jgi:hypothetical protein
MVVNNWYPGTSVVEQGDCDFLARLGYIARPYFKNQTNKKETWILVYCIYRYHSVMGPCLWLHPHRRGIMVDHEDLKKSPITDLTNSILFHFLPSEFS